MTSGYVTSRDFVQSRAFTLHRRVISIKTSISMKPTTFKRCQIRRFKRELHQRYSKAYRHLVVSRSSGLLQIQHIHHISKTRHHVLLFGSAPPSTPSPFHPRALQRNLTKYTFAIRSGDVRRAPTMSTYRELITPQNQNAAHKFIGYVSPVFRPRVPARR